MNPIASTDKQQGRLNICIECPKLDKESQKCKECGCYVAMKVWLNSSKCPLKKWE